MSFVFVSHSSTNNAHALALAQWLEGNGWTRYFLDISEDRGLKAGTRWQNELKNASHRCEAVIFVISNAWNDSKWCLAEFLLADQLGKQIFGVLIEDVPLGDLPLELTSKYQLCDLFQGDARVVFEVERDPLVPPTRVDLPEVGLDALKLGLQNAGLEATTFPWPPDNEPERTPYRGLKPYEAKDAAVFFGRDAAIVRGLDQVRQLRDHRIDRLLVILGSSGSGKSSFMRAGLWPRLKRDDHHFHPLPVVRPAGAAIDGEEGLVNSLATALAKAGVTTITRGEIRKRLTNKPNGEELMDYLRQLRDALVVEGLTDTPELTFILPIDQGEELYASDGAEEAAQLRLQLASLRKLHDDAAGQKESPNVLALITIRTDLYEHLQTDALLKDVGRQMIDLTPMDRTEYRHIIEGPAKRATNAGNALVINPELIEQLLKDTRGADALPMLAFTLERLYDNYGNDGRLTLEEYIELEGVEGSITAAIEGAMKKPQDAPAIRTDKEAQERLLKQAFIPWLAEVDDQSGEPRRRVAYKDELPAETHPFIERLTKARLLVRDLRRMGDGDERREVVEIAHEALLRQWPALVNWLDADQNALKAVGAVSRAAGQWEQNKRNDEYLIHNGERLRYAEALLGREDFKQRLKTTGCDYIARCRAVEEALKAKQENQQNRLRVAFVVAVALAIGASGLALWGYESSKEATKNAIEASLAKGRADDKAAEAIREKDRADKARIAADEKTAEAQRNLSLMHANLSRQQTKEGFPAVGALLALEALPKSMDERERPYVPEAEAALIAALGNLYVPKFHKDNVSSAAFSPDGTRIVTVASEFGEFDTARVWDADSGAELAVLRGHTDEVNSAAFSLDGTRVITDSDDGTARVWDAESGAQVTIFETADYSSDFAIAPDGTRVVGTSIDGVARVWDAESGAEIAVLEGHTDEVNSAAFSPDGTRILTSPRGFTAALWDAESGKNVTFLEGPQRPTMDAAFTPDSTLVVGTLTDGGVPWPVFVWDVESGTEVTVLEGHERRVNSAVFSTDGTLVVTASDDKTARVWDIGSGEELTVLDHGAMVDSAAFNRDNTRVVTVTTTEPVLGTEDYTARVWDAQTGNMLTVLESEHDAFNAAFSPDGSRLVTTSESVAGIAQIWKMASGVELVVLEGHTGEVHSAAFSPDGTRVITASEDGTARVWDAQSGTELTVINGDRVVSAGFYPDGTCIWIGSESDSMQVWNAESGERITALDCDSRAFNPYGTRFITRSEDGTARVWDAASGTEVAVLKGRQYPLFSAVFSPDSSRVVTASILEWSEYDKTARMWDAETGTEIAVLEGHTGEVRSATFSPDGTRVITASEDGTARVWDAASGTELTVLEGHTIWFFGRTEPVPVNGAAFSPDGSRAVTAGYDKTARVWDAETGTEIAVLEGHEGSVVSAAFSSDGTRIVTVASEDEWKEVDTTVRVWELASTQTLIDRARAWVSRTELTQKEKERFSVGTE